MVKYTFLLVIGPVFCSTISRQTLYFAVLTIIQKRLKWGPDDGGGPHAGSQLIFIAFSFSSP